MSTDGKPCILYGQLYTTYVREVIHKVLSKTNNNDKNLFFGKANDVIIPASGETAEDISTACCVLEDNIIFGGDINVIRTNHDGSFLSYQLNGVRKYDIAKLAVGKSVVHLHNDQLQNLKCCFPTQLEEEKKIVKLLDFIDTRIETQNKIIEDLKKNKRFLMNYILHNYKFKTININSFINEKYARIIKENELDRFNGERKYISTSCVGENGITHVEKIIDYNNRPSRAAMKPIANSIWFAKMKNSIKVYKSVGNDENQYVLSTGFYGLLCDNNKVSADWIYEIFKSDFFNNQKNKFSEGSSMSAIKNSQFNDINLKLFIHKNDEIKCIQCLVAIREKINNEYKVLMCLKKLKSFLLNNLFI